MSDWTDQIVGDRMAVDREFTERIAASEFSSQEWGMIMTAVEFEIEHPEQPETATLVANTEKLDQIMPALDDVGADATPMGGVPGGGGRDDRSSGGLFENIKAAIGLGDDGTDQERMAAAETLAAEYAETLQVRLEEHGKWETACEAAAAEAAAPDGETTADGDDDGTIGSE